MTEFDIGLRVRVDAAGATVTSTTITAVQPPPAPAPEPVPAPAPVPRAGVYRVIGRRLVDPDGARLVVRGVEQVFWNASWLPNWIVDEIGKTGANTVRLLPLYTNKLPDSAPRGETPCNLDQIEDQIRRAVAAHMLVDFAVDGGEDPNVFLRPEILQLIVRYERYMVLHAMGEAYQENDDDWANTAIGVIRKLRGAGLKLPLYIMSRDGGRNLPCILGRGQKVVDADPEHNIVFGWQAYWGSDLAYQNSYGMTLPTAMRKAAAAPFPIQVGLLHHSDPQDGSPQTVPYAELMRLAQDLQLGWLWWDWRMGADDLTTDGRYGSWAHRGREVVVDSTAGIQLTSHRTAYQLAQKLP